jgi:hypothetical protein
MKLTFPQQSIAATNTAQPAVGTTLTAAIAPSTIPVGGSPIPQSVAVASSAVFKKGWKAVIGAGTANQEVVDVVGIPDATHITIANLRAHSNGEFAQPHYPISSFFLQRVDGDTTPMWVGSSNLGSGATPTTGIMAKLTGVAASSQPQEFSSANNYGANPTNISEYWVYGTAATVYNVSLDVT